MSDLTADADIGAFLANEETRNQIRDFLRRSGLAGTSAEVAALTAAISASIKTFRAEASEQPRFRPTHNTLRRLWQLTTREQPPVELIRQGTAGLSDAALRAFEPRAKRLWPMLLGQDFRRDAFRSWVMTADGDKLVRILRVCIADSAMPLPGRRRAGGRQSRARLEPTIMGVVRRIPQGASYQPPPGNVPNGRPRAEPADNLVLSLALSFGAIMGKPPTPGRSDGQDNEFANLVHAIFDWFDVSSAEQTLRRFWARVECERARTMLGLVWDHKRTMT